MNKQIFLLRDCYDRDIISYGLVFNRDESITAKDIQKSIDEIKQDFYETKTDWQVDDLLEELHKIYDFEEIDFEYRNLEY